jgi:hypothetical protein
MMHVWIEGQIMKDPGDIDDDGIAVIPAKILATVKMGRRGLSSNYRCLGAS